MEKYRVTFKKSVAKDLRTIPKQEVVGILKRIDRLAENPRGDGCVKFSSQERYRVRQGLYRIVFEIREQELVVQIVKVAHR